VVSTTPLPLYPRERPGTHCTGGWVGPRAGLDVCEKFAPTGFFFISTYSFGPTIIYLQHQSLLLNCKGLSSAGGCVLYTQCIVFAMLKIYYNCVNLLLLLLLLLLLSLAAFELTLCGSSHTNTDKTSKKVKHSRYRPNWPRGWIEV
jgi:hypothetical protein